MIIYGRRSIKEALQNNLDIQKVFVKKNAKNLEKIIFELNRKKIPISFVPLVKLDKLTKGNHQGVVCQVSPIKTKSLEDLDEFLQNSTIVKILILDGVTDTRNFGSIIRNAECFGVDGIIISKTGSAPINDEVVKTSSGAIFNIQIFKVDHLIDAILILCFIENFSRSFNLAILPSSFITSQITALGFIFASLDISTEASV